MLHVTTKQERYSVAARPLTERELNQLIDQTVQESKIWFDDPRSWLTYSGFLGFQIHRAMFQYQIGTYDNPQQIDEFVTGCYNLAMLEGYPV